MIRYILVFSTIFLLVSCADNIPKPTEEKLKLNQKLFAEEDFYILLALRAEELQDFMSASTLYNKLYNRTKRKEYLYRGLKNDISFKNYSLVLKKVDTFLKTQNDDKLIRFKIVALTALSKFEEAKTLALELVKVTKETNDYILVSNIYMQLQQPELALNFLEKAYNKEFNELILDKIVTILVDNLQREDEAIAKLELHTQIYGCTQYICLRLAKFYSDRQDIDAILSLYLRLYENFKNEKVAEKIVQIYLYKKDDLKLLNFLESSKTNDKILLELYTLAQNYTKAYILANDIYLKTGDLNYLGQSAIYKYESTEDKKDKKLLADIVKKLEKVVLIEPISLYLNYLGYLLIEHNIDINKGIKYVKSALEGEPNSVYYLDSLAWGYYKKGNCKDAKKIMNTIVKFDGNDNEELMLHNNFIDRCLKN